jgi:hypothetical protein
MSAQTDKSARLAQLQEAVDAWASSRRKTVRGLIAAHKKVRQSRGELTESAALAAESLVADEISDFLA